MIGVVKEIISFFSRSTKRTNYLREAISESNFRGRIQGLIDLCETRWVERHDALILFLDLYEVIVKTLETFGESSSDRDTRTKANILLKSLCTLDFLLSINCAVKLLTVTYSLSKVLQDPQSDLQLCYEQVTFAKNIIQKIQENHVEEFGEICKRVFGTCEAMEIDVKVPRQVQSKRKEAGDDKDVSITITDFPDVEVYYRNKMFIPFITDFMAALVSRFENHNSSLCVLLKLLPTNLDSCDGTHLQDIFKFYESELTTSFTLFEAEINIWKEKWACTAEAEYPRTSLMALQSCNELFYPTTHKLLKILCFLPISVASVERSFSCLRRLKTYLRSTMNEERLTSLALMNVYHNFEIQAEDVLLEFKRSNRRIRLPWK